MRIHTGIVNLLLLKSKLRHPDGISHTYKRIHTHPHILIAQVKFHGFAPEEAIILLSPKDGEETLRDEDVLQAVKQHGACTALVFMP